MTVKEVQITACNNDDCMVKPWVLSNLRLSHVIFRHLQLVTCHGLTRQPKPESSETQALVPVFNIKPESLHRWYIPRIMAEDVISLANVLKFLSRRSLFDKRDKRASWILCWNKCFREPPLTHWKETEPETCIFCRNETSAHSHDAKQPYLSQIRTLPYL